jgi:hypothetical protein
MATSPSSQYVVTRVWLSRHKKRTFHISVGPFATRSRAETFKRRAIRDYAYPAEQLFVGVLRPVGRDEIESIESWT